MSLPLPPQPWWPRLRVHLCWAALTGLGALAIGVITFGITPDMLSMRWQAGAQDDNTLHYLVASTVVDSPFFLPNDRMGFPNLENLFFAPNYDPASAVVMTILGAILGDGITVLNVYHVLGFFSVGFTAYFFFAALRVHLMSRILFGLVFALAPFHFLRIGFGHAFVGNYWAVPLVGILLLMMAGPRTNPLESWVESALTRRSQLARRLVPILGITLLVSLSLSYFYVFAAILAIGLLLALVIRNLGAGIRVRHLLWPAVTLGALVIFIGIQLAILSLDFGDRYANYFGGRAPVESEWHAGRITSLLLPWLGTELPLLSHWVRGYQEWMSVSVHAEPPGNPFVASIGMVLIIAFVVVKLVTGPVSRRSTRLGAFIDDPRSSLMSAMFFWGLLFYVAAGFGVIFASVITPELRAWGRMSIILTLLGLGFLAVLLDALVTRRIVRYALFGVITAIAIVDQLLGVRSAIPLMPTADTEYRAYVAAAEKALPKDCGVVQLPLKAFPETGPIDQLPDYNEAIPYILADQDSLRWSYGAVRGTKSGDYWQTVTNPAQFRTAVIDSGACAVQVDTLGYVTDPESWREFVSVVSDPDDPLLVSTDDTHRFVLFKVKY